MKAKTTMTAFAAVLLAMSIPVQAHVGHNGGFSGNRLEAENYSTPDGSCDPDFDSEHTKPVAEAGTSAGEYAFLPHGGCGITFNDVHFGNALTQFSQVRARVGGQASPISITLTVTVDGTAVGSASFTASNSDGFQTYSISQPLPQSLILAGVHDVRVSYSSSPGFANLEIDYLQITHTP